MKGKGGKGRGAPTDLLVCFPSRAHLALMPKPICSPSRSAETPKRHPSRPATRGQASPLFKTKTRNLARGSAAEDISEPSSPKVTCAGQIKVSRPKPRPAAASSGSKSWLTVMEQMEDLHRRRRRGRMPQWLEAMGLKKDAMQLLHALRGLGLRMRCFGSFHGAQAGCTSDEEDEDDRGAAPEEDEDEEEGQHTGEPRTIFSKWFMLLEGSPSDGCGLKKKKAEAEEEEEEQQEEEEDEDEDEEERDEALGGCLVTPASPSTSSAVPPPNALLLMRCRSAPAKGWLLEGSQGAAGAGGEGEMTAKKMRDEEKEKERLVLMSYAPDFFKVSPDIAKETWVVGGFDPLGRSRSWKR